jgi:cytochrome P450
LADPKTYEIVFHPGEYGETEGVGDAVRMEMDKIAHAWFGIPKEVCPWTRDGLNAIRVVLSPSNGVRINEIVGSHLRDTFDSMPPSGTIDLVRLASHTFKPVNAALFGPGNVPDEAEDWFHAFDENLPQLARGVPMKAFDEMVEAYERIVEMFENAIERIQSMKEGILGKYFAPAITERIAVLQGKSKNGGDFSSRTLAQFMVSIFWAPQANTLPMTAWMLAHVLNDRRVYDEVCKEVRTPGRFGT